VEKCTTVVTGLCSSSVSDFAQSRLAPSLHGHVSEWWSICRHKVQGAANIHKQLLRKFREVCSFRGTGTSVLRVLSEVLYQSDLTAKRVLGSSGTLGMFLAEGLLCANGSSSSEVSRLATSVAAGTSTALPSPMSQGGLVLRNTPPTNQRSHNGVT